MSDRSASEAALKDLDPIHNEGLRISTGAFKSSPIKSLQVEINEPPLSLHRDMVTMRSAIRIQASDSPTKELLNAVLNINNDAGYIFVTQFIIPIYLSYKIKCECF